VDTGFREDHAQGTAAAKQGDPAIASAMTRAALTEKLLGIKRETAGAGNISAPRSAACHISMRHISMRHISMRHISMRHISMLMIMTSQFHGLHAPSARQNHLAALIEGSLNNGNCNS
jgi:hypothetical protein